MIKKVFEKVNAELSIEKLKNGIDVYLYKTDNTKNFYLTISVKYGANVTKYKINNEIIDVIPGSAHFLEHKVMALSENKEISKRINDLGSLANAWTSYYGTNYNIFGSQNIKENLKILLDLFYNTNINEQNVEEEKGIIGEEVDMYKDRIDYLMSYHLFDNLFYNSYIKNTVVGERTDLEKINSKLLNRIYKDYYSSGNTFIVITGNFDEEEIMNYIKEYMNKLKLKVREIPKRIKPKEPDKVRVSYEEMQKDVENDRVKYALKINKKLFNIKDDSILTDYLGIILSNNFSSSSKLYEKYKLSNLIINMGYGLNIVDDYVIIIISATSKNPNEFIKNIKKDIKKLKLSKLEFERNKKIYLKNYITDFDNIEDVEYIISASLMKYNRLDFDDYSKIINMSYEEAQRILSLITFDNVSIIKTIK